MKINSKHIIFFVALIITLISVASAADINDTTLSSDVTTSTTSYDTQQTDTNVITESNINHEIKNTQQTTKNVVQTDGGKTRNTTPTTYNLNNSNFDEYITVAGLNTVINDGDTLNFTENISRTSTNYTINKSVNITGNGFTLDLNTIYGYNLPSLDPTWIEFNHGASNSNITNLKFHNTQVFTTTASNITFDNINVTVENQGVGMSTGYFSMRNGVINITVKNSYFYAVNNTGCSAIVITLGENCTIDNNTVLGSGKVGNLIYLNMYGATNNANNITKNRANKITNNIISCTDGENICWGITVTGPRNVIENNTIDITPGQYGITTTWSGSYDNETDPDDTHNVTYYGNKYINNTVNGKFSTGNYSIIENNTINGASTINGHAHVTNNTFLAGVSLHNNVRFHSNDATGQTITVQKANSCFKDSIIGTLTLTNKAKYTYDCGGNTIGTITQNLYTNYFKNCSGNCPNCGSTGSKLLSKLSTKQLKTDSNAEIIYQGTVVTSNDLTIYNNGTVEIILEGENARNVLLYGQNPYQSKINEQTIDITDIVIYVNSNSFSTGGNQYDMKSFKLNFDNKENINLKVIGAITKKGGLEINGGWKTVTYENLKIISDYNEDTDRDIALILNGDNITLRNITYTSTSTGAAAMAIFAGYTDNTGVSGGVLIRGNNIMIENSEFSISQEEFINITEWGLDPEDFPNDFHNYGFFFYKANNITFRNNNFLFLSMDKDSSIESRKYSPILGGNVTTLSLVDNEVNVRYVPGIKLVTNNSLFENNTITVQHADNTIELTGDNNIVRYNTLTSKSGEGDSTVVVTGENNVVEQNPKVEPKTIIVTQDNVEDVFGGEGHTLGADVNPGDTLDFQGLIDKNHSLVINKPVTVVSTTKDAFISLHTVAGSLMGEDPGNSFVVNIGGSGSFISGLYLNNTECWIHNVYNAVLYNMTMHVENARVGSGVGQTSLRYCNNVTIDSCYIYTENNGGSSSFVWTGCNNCTIINSTVQAEGSVGNLLYVGNPFNTADKPADYVMTNFDNKVINCTVLGGSGGSSNPLQNGGQRTLVQGNKFYSGGSAGVAAFGVTGATATLVDNEFYRTVGMYLTAGSTAYNNVFYGTGSTTVQANAQVYNNTLNAVTISGADALFENNTVKGKLTVNQPTNVKDNNLADVQVGTNGKNSNITNNNVTGTITSGAANVVIDSNNITTTNDNTVVVTGANNTVTNNILYTRTKAGDETLNVKDDTTVEGNIPESGEEFELTDENYLKFFDTNGNLINTNVTNYSTLTFKGEFNNKVFKFNNIILSLTGEEAVINNGYISTDNGAIVALENMVFNNTREGIPNSVLLNSDGNLVRNVTVYRTSNSGISREIMVNGDKNSILSNKFDLTIPVENIDYSEYPFAMSNASAISVTGSENIINSNTITVRNSTAGTGTISVIDLASRTKSSGNTVNSNTIVAESTGYLYGINLGSNTDANTINSNNIKLSSDVYTAGIQIGYSPAKDNTINSNTINLTSPIAYGVLASAYEGEITGTTVNSNKVYISANQGVGIELCGSIPESINDATINSNTIVVDGNYCIGIAVSGSDIDVNTNTITVTGTRNDTDETSYDIIKPTTSGIILYNSENIEALNNVITAENGANIILNGTSNSKVTRTTNNKNINTENGANIVLDNSNNNLIDNQIAYTTSEYAVILTNSSNNNITNNNLNASNINGGDAAISMDENSKDNYLYNNIPVFGVLTDETYSTFFDENSTYKFPEGINILSLGGDLHNKDLIFTNNLTFVNAGNYTIYNGSIIVSDVEGSRYDNRFVYFTNININNTDKPVFIGNLSTDQQRNIEFRGGVFTVTGDNITAFESVHGPKTYTVLDVEGVTVIMDGKDVTAFKMSREEYTKNDYLDVEKSNITLKSTGKNTAFEVIQTNLDILGNNITQTGSDVLTAYIENAYANGKFFGENNINASGEKVAILILNETQGNNPTIGNNNITATSPNPVPAITIITSKNSYVGQGQYSYSSYNYPNTIIINAENGEVPIVNITGNGYVRNNFIMSNDLYGAEGVNATTVSNITPTRTSINLTAPEQVKVFDEITINVTANNATTTSDGRIILKINEEEVANSKSNTLSYTFTPTEAETLNIVAEYIYQKTQFVSSTENATIKVEKLNTTLTLDTNRPYLDENLTISGTLMDENNKAINDTQLTITVNNETVNITTDSEGKYNYTTSPVEGNNTITVSFNGENSYESKEQTKSFIVIDLEKYAMIDELNKTVKQLNDTVNNQTETIGKLNDTINNQTAAIEDLENTVEELKDIVNNLTSTKPTTITFDAVKGAKVGDKITISGQLSDENGFGVPGTIKLLINNGRATVKTNANGVFTYDYTVTKVGTYNVTASYLGTKSYNPTNNTMSFDVAQQDTSIIIDEITPVKSGNNVTVTGKLVDANGNPIKGTIKLLINNGRATVKTDDSGVFTYTFVASKVGVNNISASYLESTKYLASNTTATVEVTAMDTQIVFDKISSAKKGEKITISGKLLDENGNAITGTIKLLINNGRATVKTDKNGVFTYEYTVTKVGVNNITASYLGANRYSASNATTTAQVEKLATVITLNNIGTVTQKSMVKISGKLADENGKAVTGTIKLLINNGRKTIKTDNTGAFTYSHNATWAGQNTITATYLESNNYLPTNSTTTFTVTKA